MTVGLLATTLAVLVAAGAGCASLPRPPAFAPPETAFVEVPGPPPPSRVEVVPPQPKTAKFWIDGAWAWEGSRWKWAGGGWFTAPPGVRYADWAVKRREDGTLLYANPQWFDERGAPVAAPQPIVPAPMIGGQAPEQKT